MAGPLVAGFLCLTGCGHDFGPAGPERTETRSIDLDKSEEVRVDLKMGAGELRVRGGADKLMEGLTTLSPRRLSALLAACRSVKVKRLALWFADRHGHAWAKPLDRTRVDLGVGNRVLEPGGRLDRTYQITVPREMEAV